MGGELLDEGHHLGVEVREFAVEGPAAEHVFDNDAVAEVAAKPSMGHPAERATVGGVRHGTGKIGRVVARRHSAVAGEVEPADKRTATHAPTRIEIGDIPQDEISPLDRHVVAFVNQSLQVRTKTY